SPTSRASTRPRPIVRPTRARSRSGSRRRPHSSRRRNVPAAHSFDYAVVRVVPRVDREEFVNAGVILFCLARSFLAARVALDAARVRALHPGADLALIEEHLASV